MANSNAFLFNTGNDPGSPKHTGQVELLGDLPKSVEQPQKAFDLVNKWT